MWRREACQLWVVGCEETNRCSWGATGAGGVVEAASPPLSSVLVELRSISGLSRFSNSRDCADLAILR